MIQKNDHVHDLAPSTRGGDVGGCAALYTDAECVVLHEVSEHAEGERMLLASGVDFVVSVKRVDMSADDIVVMFLDIFYAKLATSTLSEAFRTSIQRCQDTFPALSVADDIFKLWPGKVPVWMKFDTPDGMMATLGRRCVASAGVLVLSASVIKLWRGSVIVELELTRGEADELVARARADELGDVVCFVRADSDEPPVWRCEPRHRQLQQQQLARNISAASVPSSLPQLRQLPAWGQTIAAVAEEEVYFDLILRAPGAGDLLDGSSLVTLAQRLGCKLSEGGGEGGGGSSSSDAAGGGDAAASAIVDGFHKIGDSSSLRIRLRLQNVRQLHALRDDLLLRDDSAGAPGLVATLVKRLLGPAAFAELASVSTETSWSFDSTPLVESYEMAVLQLHELTDQQIEACSACEEQLRALSGGAGTVRLDGPPGTGKTFVACHLLLKQLEEPGEIVFVCRKRALALFVARWLCVRRVSSSREAWSAMLRRVRFVFEARDGRPCAHALSIGPGRIDAAVDAVWPPPAASLVFVDEAHHLYAAPQWEQWEPILASLPAAPCLLLSDDSQAHARTAYPSELGAVRLTEVVRCTPRIRFGCSDFALRHNQDGISCAHARPGPPLEARFFAAGAEATYATEIAAAVKRLAERFPGDGLLDDRVAILVPDAAFAEGIKASLEAALTANFEGTRRRVSLIDAEEAAATLFSAACGGSERLVLSSIDDFDGLERLFVIVAGMDAAGDGVRLACSRLYRGISRAHMHVTLVEEERAGGPTERLRGVRLEGEVDHEEELARRKVGAAEDACEAAKATVAAAAAAAADYTSPSLWQTYESSAGIANDGEVWSPFLLPVQREEDRGTTEKVQLKCSLTGPPTVPLGETSFELKVWLLAATAELTDLLKQELGFEELKQLAGKLAVVAATEVTLRVDVTVEGARLCDFDGDGVAAATSGAGEASSGETRSLWPWRKSDVKEARTTSEAERLKCALTGPPTVPLGVTSFELMVWLYAAQLTHLLKEELELGVAKRLATKFAVVAATEVTFRVDVTVEGCTVEPSHCVVEWTAENLHSSEEFIITVPADFPETSPFQCHVFVRSQDISFDLKKVLLRSMLADVSPSAATETLLSEVVLTRRKTEDIQEELRKQAEEQRKQAEERLERLERLEQLIGTIKAELRRTREVLRKSIFEATGPQVPTAFVMLPEKLPEPPSAAEKKALLEIAGDGSGVSLSGDGFSVTFTGEAARVGGKYVDTLNTSMKWLCRLKNVGSKVAAGAVGEAFGTIKEGLGDIVIGKTMYFYLVDDLTGEPVRDPSGHYPIEIKTPSDVVPKLLPVMQVGLHAMSVINGAAGVARMFGYPVPTVPAKWAAGSRESVELLKRKSSVDDYGVVQAILGQEGVEKESRSVRGASLRELQRFFEEHDAHKGFAGLHRTGDDDGTAVWTALTDPSAIKAALEARAKERLAEQERRATE